MAIDKIKLRRLARDKDERLFQEGDMLDALNVVVSADGVSSDGVVKNTTGTLPGSAATTADQIPNEEARVVGSVADPARGFVYFFVWSTTDRNHSIYRYDSSTHEYKLVLRRSILNFSKFGFVKADVITGEFESDSQTQSIVYFTDDVNPPRKINVDRFIADDLPLYTDQEIFEMISAAKTPVLLPPLVSLGTNDNKDSNNLYGSTYQFAVQVKYKDGELSALSPHSEIIYPKYMAIQGVQQSSTDLGVLFTDNRIDVDVRWTTLPADFSYYKEDVDEIRLMVKENNSQSFYLVESFDPNQNISRNGETIYNSSNGVYRFYNEGLSVGVSSEQTDKVYDDVPQFASSQAISGNRLMYSSPIAGYPNTDVDATITVNYLPSPTATYGEAADDYDGMFSVTQSPTSTNKASIKIDYSALDANISAGSIITVDFEYKPSDILAYGYTSDGAGADFPLIKMKFGSSPDSDDVTLFAGEATDSQGADYEGSIDLDLSTESATNTNNVRASNLNWQRLRASVTTTETLTKDQAIQLLVDEIEEQLLRFEYNSPSETLVFKLRDSEGDEAGKVQVSKLEFSLKFLVSQVAASDYILLTPRIGDYFIPNGEVSSTAGAMNDNFVRFYSTWGATQPANLDDYSYFNGIEDAVPTVYQAGGYQRDGVWFNLTDGVVDYIYEYYSDGLNNDTPVVNGFKDESFVITPTDAIRTFKAGCEHSFGIVYFDRHGRPGYVNELGSVNVAPFGDVDDREDPDNAGTYFNGPCEISIDLDGTPPDWAVAYQIVYSDMGSWQDFESYTVGGAWWKGEDAAAETEEDAIYVSFNTLAKYQSDKGAIKDYSFTPGDKLRVISYFESDSDSEATFLANPEQYTFDVSNYVTLSESITGADDTHTNKSGKFLVLSLPFGNEPTNFTPGESTNFWRNRCLVEILTPRKRVEQPVYYEIGEARRIYKSNELSDSANDRHNDGEAIVTNEGSVYFKPVSCLAPDFSGSPGAWQVANIADLEYEVRMLESSSVSDFNESKAWSKGRAHVTYDRADTVDFYNRISYSDEMGDDIGGLTFSSFNPGAFSYKNMPKKYGSVNYIHEYNQNLVCLQENKLSYIPVNRNVIEYADGDSQITASTSVLGTHQESNGDFGVGSDASSVVVRDGMVFFVDASRQKVLMAVGSQLMPISDADMSSYFENEFDLRDAESGDGGRIVGGYEPEEDMFLITIEPKGSGYPGTTVGYSVGDKAWISRYSFTPSNYATIDNVLLSGSWYQNEADTESYLMNAHRNTLKNTFYGTAYNTEVEVVSKMSPSEVKVFNAVSYEGDSSAWDMTPGMTTDLGQTSGTITTWNEKEGAYYAAMPKDTAYKYVYIGTIASDGITIGNGLIQLDDISRLDRFGFKVNSEYIYYNDGGTYSQTGLTNPKVVTGFDLDAKTISTTAPTAVDGNGKKLYFRLSTDGNAMRGRWGKIKLVNSSTSSHELYAINTHVAGSKLHHPKGQQ